VPFFVVNSREFFYSQIEKYARQYLTEGVRHAADLIITSNSDLYRILNLHYNRSNQIDVRPN
jgi:prospero homeobox 1